MTIAPLPSPSLPPSGGGGELPVGTILPTTDPTNPATTLGYGTWSAFGAGRTLVGLDAGDTDFDTVEETGGAKTASHTHGAGTYQGDYESDHAHGIGTLATVAESSHTHGTGSLATVAESAHTHGAGTLVPSAHSGTAVANHSSHTHYINFATSDATITAHAQHRHELLKANLPAHAHSILGSNLAHSHTLPVYNHATGSSANKVEATSSGTANSASTGSGGPGTISTENEGNAGACYTEYTTQGNHTLGGKTEGEVDGVLTHSVTQPAAHTMSGSTGAGSSHSHGVSGSTGTGSSHSHGMSGAPAAGGGHGHTVSGTSASGGGSVVQPYIVVYFWKRIA